MNTTNSYIFSSIYKSKLTQPIYISSLTQPIYISSLTQPIHLHLLQLNQFIFLLTQSIFKFTYLQVFYNPYLLNIGYENVHERALSLHLPAQTACRQRVTTLLWSHASQRSVDSPMKIRGMTVTCFCLYVPSFSMM